MTPVQISEDFLLTTKQVADITGIDQGRVQRLVAKHDLCERTTGGKSYGHMRVRYGNLGKLIALDEETKKAGRNRSIRNSLLHKMIDDLSDRVELLEKVVDEMTAREVAPEEIRG